MQTPAYNYLLRCLLPYLLGELNLAQPSEVRLRGVVRTSDGHARIALSADRSLRTGVALDFDLAPFTQGYELADVVDFVRARFSPNNWMWHDQALEHDVHGNVIVSEELAGLATGLEDVAATRDPQRGLNSLLTQSLGQSVTTPMDFELLGFMLLNNTICRLYLHTEKEGSVGIQIPSAAPGVGGTFATELSGYAATANLGVYPRIDGYDEYCDAVFDLTGVVDPPPLLHRQPFMGPANGTRRN